MESANLLRDEIMDAEETIYYWLFPYNPDWTPITEEEKLKDLVSEYLAFLQPTIQDYIWYNENFSLKLVRKSPGECPGTHIGGRTVVGDYLEDEWFIFFLLTSLTKEFPHLICRVFDNDGEFPLIEAAFHLPSWANHQTADQRVYLREGAVHLVPPSVLPLAPKSVCQIAMAAVGQVARLPTATLASPAVQSAVALRIEEYPRKISKEHHSTHAFVPVGVAALLYEYPTLVSVAVRAFCNRDALDNKCLRMMRHFPPETRVMTSVRFSKALYALLSSHPYTPDSRTGWNLPSNDNNTQVIGMKVACGFEILICSAGGVTPSAMTPADESEVSSTLDNNPQWIKYREALKEKGYFRGELEGSKLFQELEENARRFFLSSHNSDSLSVGSLVVKLFSKVNVDYDTFKQREKLLLPPDDEKWLEVSPDDLDEMLKTKFQSGEIKNPAKSEQDIADSINAFIRHTSSYEGAEIPDELKPKPRPSNRKFSSGMNQKKNSTGNGPRKLSGLHLLPQHRKISSHSNASDSSDMSSLSAKVDFNADAFTDALNNILELSVPEDEYFEGGNSDSSGMSSYEDDDEGEVSLSRKTSDGSSVSKASSGVDTGVEVMPQSQRPPNKSSSSNCAQTIPLAYFDDFEDFDDDDDVEAVTQLLHAHKQEAGQGPTTSLLGSLGLNPPKQ